MEEGLDFWMESTEGHAVCFAAIEMYLLSLTQTRAWDKPRENRLKKEIAKNHAPDTPEDLDNMGFLQDPIMPARVASNFYTGPISGLGFLVCIHFEGASAQGAAIGILLLQNLIHHCQRALFGVGFHSYFILNPPMHALAPFGGQIKSIGTGNFESCLLNGTHSDSVTFSL